MIIGHRAIVNHFAALVSEGRLSQAYGFAGPHGVGKRTVAELVSAQLLGIIPQKLASHPDYFFLDRGIDEKTGKPKTEISVGSARGLRSALQKKSWGPGYRAVIINEAETLSAEANSALLKIVEESPERTVIFFLIDRAENLMPTILSRLEVFWFNPVPETEIKEGLVALGASPAVAAELARESWGLPGRALDFFRDPEARSQSQTIQADFSRLLAAPLAHRLKIIETYTEKKEGARVAEGAAEALDAWSMAARSLLRQSSVVISAHTLVKLLDAFSAAKIMLKQNVNARLVLENIFLNI